MLDTKAYTNDKWMTFAVSGHSRTFRRSRQELNVKTCETLKSRSPKHHYWWTWMMWWPRNVSHPWAVTIFGPSETTSWNNFNIHMLSILATKQKGMCCRQLWTGTSCDWKNALRNVGLPETGVSEMTADNAKTLILLSNHLTRICPQYQWLS